MLPIPRPIRSLPVSRRSLGPSVGLVRRRSRQLVAVGLTALAVGTVPTARAVAAPSVPAPDAAVVRSAEQALGTKAVPGANDAPYAYYKDDATAALIVETGSTTGVFAGTLRSRYGASVQLRAVKVSRATRTNDSSPHYGGSRISAGGTSCTSGVAFVRAGVRHMITSGHCFNVNTNVYSGPSYYGLINIRKFPNPDLALINGNGSQGYSPLVYIDPTAYTAKVVTR